MDAKKIVQIRCGNSRKPVTLGEAVKDWPAERLAYWDKVISALEADAAKIDAFMSRPLPKVGEDDPEAAYWELQRYVRDRMSRMWDKFREAMTWGYVYEKDGIYHFRLRDLWRRAVDAPDYGLGDGLCDDAWMTQPPKLVFDPDVTFDDGRHGAWRYDW